MAEYMGRVNLRLYDYPRMAKHMGRVDLRLGGSSRMAVHMRRVDLVHHRCLNLCGARTSDWKNCRRVVITTWLNYSQRSRDSVRISQG